MSNLTATATTAIHLRATRATLPAHALHTRGTVYRE